ncbi:hypothetical protein X946_5541 [Burkholderia sp. ABCPW 111]|nr:hypothetical protein X946_5541 [Burkholderia sp. ABCPW 111]
MTIPTPATQMARASFYCPQGAVRLHARRRQTGTVPYCRRVATQLPDVLRKMMNNIQTKENA